MSNWAEGLHGLKREGRRAFLHKMANGLKRVGELKQTDLGVQIAGRWLGEGERKRSRQ